LNVTHGLAEEIAQHFSRTPTDILLANEHRQYGTPLPCLTVTIELPAVVKEIFTSVFSSCFIKFTAYLP